MRKIFYLFLVFISILINEQGASAWQEIKYHISEHDVDFVSDSGKHLTLSKQCLKGAELFCLAFESTKKASLKSIYGRLQGGVNPGAVICRGVGGQVIVGVDSEKNENSFCLFSDRSLIDNGSLVYFGSNNDAKGK